MSRTPVHQSAMVGLSIGVLLGLAAGCAPAPAKKPTHLLVISIDTLRADFLGAYGHPWIQTPNIDEFALEGFLFEQHISASATTLPSHTSLFTGMWPHSHGVPRNGFVVHDENLMLSEVLAASGFQTAAFIGGHPLVARYGFAQGFEHFEADFDPQTPGLSVYGSQRSAKGLTDAALSWLDRRNDERPLFLFMHYFDVHAPYMAPDPYYRMYREDDLPITGTLEDTFRMKGVMKRKMQPGALAQFRRESRALEQLYAGEVTYTDAHIGRLIDWLREHQLLDDTLVVITSDHGETMDEHPFVEVWDHAEAVFDTTIHTPLIIRLPGAWGAGTRLPQLVSNIDVMPTLLELLGLPIPRRIEGRSFRAAMDGTAFTPRRHTFSEATKPATADYEKGRRWPNELKPRAVRTSDYKLIEHRKQGSWRLHDLQADPGELKPMDSFDHGAVQDRLEKLLAAWGNREELVRTRRDIDPASQKLLEALGYVEETEQTSK